MKLWKCSVCGYLHEGDNPPERCPKCGAPEEKFEMLDDTAAELINKSRITNALHVELLGIMEGIEQIAADGIDINLDPGCTAIFKDAENWSRIMAQKIKAEIETHVKKGKWG